MRRKKKRVYRLKIIFFASGMLFRSQWISHWDCFVSRLRKSWAVVFSKNCFNSRIVLWIEDFNLSFSLQITPWFIWHREIEPVDWSICLQHSWFLIQCQTSLLSSSGSAKEAQREFLVLVQDAIHFEECLEISTAIDQEKVRLDIYGYLAHAFMSSSKQSEHGLIH